MSCVDSITLVIMSCLDSGSWGGVPLGKLTPCALLADLGSWGGEPPNKKSIKHGLDPFIDYRGGYPPHVLYVFSQGSFTL